jgi:hypothetical protein
MRATKTSRPGIFTFMVRCRQETSPGYWSDHIERVEATCSLDALSKVREAFLPRLKRETHLDTRDPRGESLRMTITWAEIRQARGPHYTQLELPL